MMTLALFVSLLVAQDASVLLQTFVQYNTMKSSLPLSPEQKQEADRLVNAAQRANFEGKPGAALRLLSEGMVKMNGVDWTPAVESAAGLQAKADHGLLSAGQAVNITLAPRYEVTRPEKLSATVWLVGEGSAATQLAEAKTLDQAVVVKLPSVTPPGNYFLETRLTTAEGAAIPARAAAVKSIPVRIDGFAPEIAKLRARLARTKNAPAAAEYILALVDRADKGDANPHRYQWNQEIARANTLLDATAAGRAPWAGVKGDVRSAYRSAVDQSLQPYRLYIPAAFDGKKPLPLVVALHGMGGDENSFFDQYQKGVIKQEAERRGFFVVCPKGRGPASMYRGDAERDVLDVLADVKKSFPIDENRVYLMGHSMGGYGTWSIAINHPQVFAALGPIAGGGNAGAIDKIKHIPQYVVHGDADPTVPVTQSRAMVKAAEKAGMKTKYVEVPGGNHTEIVVPHLAPMFDFFAEHAKAVLP